MQDAILAKILFKFRLNPNGIIAANFAGWKKSERTTEQNERHAVRTMCMTDKTSTLSKGFGHDEIPHMEHHMGGVKGMVSLDRRQVSTDGDQDHSRDD
jgi:hypothetical protein